MERVLYLRRFCCCENVWLNTMEHTRVARPLRLTPLVPEEKPLSYSNFTQWLVSIRPAQEAAEGQPPDDEVDP